MPYLTDYVVVVIAVAALASLLYWLLVITEGAYLGRRVVVFLYDRFARRYDGVKQYDPRSDAFHLAGPIVAHDRCGRVLDVATGTGRLPAALAANAGFCGTVHGVDASAAMLQHALPKFHGDERIQFSLADAVQLPFADAVFDCVTCLEALEFFPQRGAALRELLRVLRPGGLLIISNRVGPDAWKLPRRVISSERLAAELAEAGAPGAVRRDWLVDYDLLSVRKAGTSASASAPAAHSTQGVRARH